jgi:hypothetical protein
MVLCSITMLLVGYLVGSEAEEADREILAAEDWHQHVQSALFVARRSLGPDYEVTQEMRP